MSQDTYFSGLHALVVEDSAHMRALLRSMLRALGFSQVSAESNGATALPIIDTVWPDVVLVDWNMPDMNGIEVVKAIRKLDGPQKLTPIIMITAHASAQRLAEASAIGVNSFLCKPLSAVRLNDHLRDVIEGAYMQPLIEADAGAPVASKSRPSTPAASIADKILAPEMRTDERSNAKPTADPDGQPQDDDNVAYL